MTCSATLNQQPKGEHMEFVIAYLIAAAIAFAILFAVIRAAVRAALMDHHESVNGTSLGAPLSAAGPAAPLKWWQR